MASNHSFESFEGLDAFDQKKSQPPKDSNAFGGTGNFPNGKLTESDEGEIQFGITKKDNTIIMEFGKPVHWMGFNKQQAVEVAKILCKHAGVVMTIEIQ